MTRAPYVSILAVKIKHQHAQSKLFRFLVICCLSWLYALASQIIIPLPWNFVPISLQPLPLFLCSLLFGWPAVYAYLLYYIQGALGAPFFAGMLGGMGRILGPTGGYLLGFGLSAAFLAATRHWKQQSRIGLLAKLYCAYAITFACGLAQLAWFIPASILLSQGLYPFLIGDLIIKTGAIYKLLSLKKSSSCRSTTHYSLKLLIFYNFMHFTTYSL